MPPSPRYELENACLMKGWDDGALASKLIPPPHMETVRRWKTGIQTPHNHYITQLCALFKVKHPKELNLDAQFNASLEEEEPMLRRDVLEYIRSIAIIGGVDPSLLSATLSAAIDDPDELLHACREALDECWNLHYQKANTLADNIIKGIMPGLRDLAIQKSRHQHEAALLAVEARILQMIIAMGKEDYKRRVSLGNDAVTIGETSGDRNLHAAAIGWHGGTFIGCYNQPETAIDLLKKVLPHINDLSPLNRASIYMDLATVCALDESDKDKEARKARGYIEMAHMAMPDNPEVDPLYQSIRIGSSELDQYEGKTYLILAKRFPSQKEYAQKAYTSLVKATSQEALSTGYRCQALITQSDAARVVGNMQQYFDCLEKGLHLSLQIGNQRHITKAIMALQKAPMKWRNEKQYKDIEAIVRRVMTPTKTGQ